MKMTQIKEMTDKELQSQLTDLIKERYNLKFQSKMGQLKNSARIKTARVDIARIKTEITKRKSKVIKE